MERNSVILFYPKTEKGNLNKNIPLALLKISSELRCAGYEVVIVDERFEEDYENLLKDVLNKAVFFGVSAMTGYQICSGLKASSFVKKLNRSLPVVWGGWHASILPEETLENDNIDIVVKGQGELTVCDVANALKDKKDLKGIEGILYKENGNVHSNNCRGLHDLNKFRMIRFDTIEIERYIFKSPLGARSIFWNSSQGCPYCCGFCSTATVYKRMWSGLRAERLLEELKTLAYDYKINGVTFAEDNFFVDLKRVEELCLGIIESNLKIKWAADARVDQISRFSERFLHLLQESGCVKLYIGAESGDEDVLSLIDKKIKLSQTYEAADKLDKYKIISEFFIIVGFPNNPKKDLERSLEMMKRIKSRYPDSQFTPFVYTPYPGTPLLNVATKFGLKVPKKLEDWSDWNILSVHTPWIDKKYLDCVNMHSKCFYPLAFPSSSLRKKLEKKSGVFYRLLHILSRIRVKNNFFLFPLEWKLIKTFYKLKVKFNLFKDINSFR